MCVCAKFQRGVDCEDWKSSGEKKTRQNTSMKYQPCDEACVGHVNLRPSLELWSL